MALAEKMLAAEFGKKIVDHHTYVLVLRRRPDGRRLAGSDRARRALEAQQADRAVGRQRHLDRRPDLAFRLGRPGEALQVRRLGAELIDGHDQEAVAAAIARAQKSNKPSMIACKTTIGYGAPTKAGTAKAHGEALGADE